MFVVFDERLMEFNFWCFVNGIGFKLDKLRIFFDCVIIVNSFGGIKVYLDFEDGNDIDNDGIDF